MANSAIPTLTQASAVTQTSSSTYNATLSPEWVIGSVPHGGYVGAVINNAVALHFKTTLKSYNQPDLLTAHYEYIRRTSASAATVSIKPLKLGRQTSTVYATLSQPDKDGNQRNEVVALITHTNLSALSGASFDTNWKLRDPPALPTPTNLRNPSGIQDPNWVVPRQLPFSEFRRATNRVRWLLPRHESLPGAAAFRPSKGEYAEVVDLWMGFATRDPGTGQHERFTTGMLAFAADMFPQIVEIKSDPGLYTRDPAQDSRKPKSAGFWFPTLLMNVEVKRALPAEGAEWLMMRLASREVRNGRYDLDVSIFDESGHLVALSQHVVFALPAARNTSARGSFEDGKGKGKL